MTKDKMERVVALNTTTYKQMKAILDAVHAYCSATIGTKQPANGSFYNFTTIIEPSNVEYRVVGQDGSLPVPLFYGTYDECVKWRSENCR